ncbi:DUF2269 domain-containing protein [Corynebacterium sp. A21]|uniref:DUF2269 domain-containing protein n=1 Tax=Corynebacterium sp. A21 TaxID=3457318 RepID=UPI003FD1946D
MSTIFIFLHVLTAVLFLGPVTYATSSFHVRAVEAHSGSGKDADKAAGMAKLLHKVTNTYGMLSLLIPILGVAVMFTNTAYWKMGNFHASIALAVIAWALLLFLIIPRQKKMVGALGLLDAEDAAGKTFEIADWKKAKGQLSMFGGIFALLWVIILVLMFL